MLVWLGWLYLAVTVVGCIYALGAAFAVRVFARTAGAPSFSSYPGIAVLKPLRGAELGLYQALASFCVQDYPGPVQILFGARDAADACVPVVRKLIAEFPTCDLELVIFPALGDTDEVTDGCSVILDLVKASRSIC